MTLANEEEQEWALERLTWTVADSGPARGVAFKATGDLVRYGWEQVGSIEVPARFVATFTTKNYAVEMLITAENGAAGYDAIKIMRRPGRPRLSHEAVRRIGDSANRWTDYACARVFDLMFEQRKNQDQLIEQQKMIKARRDQDRQYITDGFLDEVAAIYKAAKAHELDSEVNGKPIQAIQKKYPHAGHSTVRRWVEKGRDAGKIPPSGRPKRKGN
jgi:hypothetical protein